MKELLDVLLIALFTTIAFAEKNNLFNNPGYEE